MEEEYDYLTIKAEIPALQDSVKAFMADQDVKNVFRDTYKLTLVRGSSGRWVPDKLKALVPKNVWLKITKLTVDPEKIDDLVRKGDLDRKQIESAYVTTANKPHVRTYEYPKGQDKDAAIAEEMALRQAMGGNDKPKKRGKK